MADGEVVDVEVELGGEGIGGSARNHTGIEAGTV
jgi:hypothetical protein